MSYTLHWRICDLPYRNHSNLLAPVSGLLPLKYENVCRSALFIAKSMSSANTVVSFITKNGIYSRMMLSPIERNVFHCCSFCGLQRFDLFCISKKLAWNVAVQSLSPVSDKLNIIIELLRVKFNYMQLSLPNRAEVDFMLYCLCTL